MKTFCLTAVNRRFITAIFFSLSPIVNNCARICKIRLLRFENFNSHSATVTIVMSFLCLDLETNWSAYQQGK